VAVEREANPKVEIAHVLAMDIVEYSTLLITEQTRVMGELKNIVKSSERFRRAEADGKLVRIPTGDGIALVFFSEPDAPIECAMEISAALKSHPEIRVRMGIHGGPVNQVVDVSDRANVAGAGIDIAQRVMDCGDAGHILLSKRVADDLVPFPRWNPHLHDLGECEVKHGRKISLVNFYTNTVGNPQPPRKCRPAQQEPETRTPPRKGDSTISRKSVLVGAAALLVLALAIGLLIFSHQAPPQQEAKQTPPAARPNSKSIAVLPFENLSHDPDNAYFADGIQEEILTRLSKIADLKVISRTSTQRYKTAPNNLSEIGKQLGVANILEGTVQKAADQVRVNVQLINAETDSHLWADKYDRKLADIFAVESEVATKIAETLQAKLTGAEQHAIVARPTENSEAYQLYLKGRYFGNKLTPDGFQKAIEYFQQAIEKDPAYALAYAGLSDSYEMLGFWGVLPPQEMWPKAKAAALKALEIDDNLAEAHVALGWVSFTYDWDWPAAEKHFERALALNPSSPAAHHQWYSIYLGALGRSDDALAEAKRALDLDPVSPVINHSVAEQLYLARRFDEAIEQCRKTLEMDPSFPLTYSLLGRAYLAKGMYGESLVELEKYLALSPRNPAALAGLAYAHARSGERNRALGVLDELRALSKQRHVASYLFAIVYAGLGEKDQAFAWLEKAYEERDGSLPMLKVNPTWDPLRSDPRFADLARRVGIPQ
jgi:TolB-like protein/Flp pilus assembly protein TadD